MHKKAFANLKWWEAYIYSVVLIIAFGLLYIEIVNNKEISRWLLAPTIFVGANILCLYWQWSVARFFVGMRSNLRRVSLLNVSIIFNIAVALTLIVLLNIGYLQSSMETVVDFPPLIEEAYFILYTYSSFWVAKTIVSFERGHQTRFIDFLGTGIQVMFLPLTIFVLQPRINKIYRDKTRGKQEAENNRGQTTV